MAAHDGAMMGDFLRRFSPAVILVAFFSVTFPLWSNAYLASPDSASYRAVSRTITHGGNLDFLPDYEALEFRPYLYYLTERGRISNDWPIGSGLLWLPPYAAAHGVALGAGALGIEGPSQPPGFPERALLLPRTTGTGMHEPALSPSGKSGIYKLFVTTWVAGLALAALLLGVAIVEPHTGRGRAVAAALLVVLGTPVGFYIHAFAIMSHIPSMFAAGLLFWGWHRTRRERTPLQWAGLGAVAGVMVMVRPQDGVFLSLFLVELVMNRREVLARWRQWLAGTAIAAGAALVAFSPQMITWWTIYGNPLQLPKIEEMHWLRPRLMDTLFSDYHGMVSWSPLLLLVPVGVWFLWRRDRVLAVAVGLVIAIQVYLNAANEIWWAGGSFGNRRMVACGVPFVVAIAAALGLGRWRYTLPVVVPLTAWNFLLWARERAGELNLGHYVPWDGEFVAGVLGMALPWRAFHAMLGDFAGFGWPVRILFMVLGLALAAGLHLGWFAGLRRCPPRRLLAVPVAYFALMPVLFLVLAARTPVYTEADFEVPPPSENLSLFDGYYEYGFFNLRKERVDEAEQAFLRAGELLPSHPNPHRYLASIRMMRGDPRGALEHARKALDRQPVYPMALLVMESAVAEILRAEPWNRTVRAEMIGRLRAAGFDGRAEEWEEGIPPPPG